MSDTTDLTHFKKHVNVCIGVFIALLVFTVITVAVAQIDMGKSQNITIALIIATFKASLVAAYFMHLNAEKKTIFRVLFITFIFFAALLFITLGAFYDYIKL